MYQAINNKVIVTQVTTEKKTESGIILPDGQKIVREFKVVATTEETKALQDKTVVCEPRLARALDEKYGSLEIENILAVKE